MSNLNDKIDSIALIQYPADIFNDINRNLRERMAFVKGLKQALKIATLFGKKIGEGDWRYSLRYEWCSDDGGATTSHSTNKLFHELMQNELNN